MNRNSEAMGTEKVPKLLAQLAIPAVVAQVINLLYNIVDRIYIGHIPEIGADALTGAGLFMPILMLINAFAMLAGSGGAPRASIFMGKQDNKTAEKIMGNCFSLLLMLSVVLTVVFYIFAPQLLVMFGASEATLPYALDYSRIYILGTVFVLIVMGMNPFITTQGFAKISIPINAILQHLTGISSLRAYLPWQVALVLIAISVVLTMFAGVIPSRSAAKKDPVVALRTE